jgi:hypothetical protein
MPEGSLRRENEKPPTGWRPDGGFPRFLARELPYNYFLPIMDIDAWLSGLAIQLNTLEGVPTIRGFRA